MRWRIREWAASDGSGCVERLWRAAMPPAWPVLPTGIAQLNQGLVADSGSGVAGFAALDPAGSVPLILVDPAWQRHGIGTRLLAEAAERVRASGAIAVTAGSGGASYIWPGVPTDLPDAVRFFRARGWRRTHDTVDLVADLTDYCPPPGAGERADRIGIAATRAGDADLASVLAFEAAVFPRWLRYFSEAASRDILIARDGAGNIAGTLLLDGADSVYAPLLGPAAGAIGCVGVAPARHGQGIGTALVVRASEILRDAGTRTCHIGWTTRESFYRHAGYRPWRRYAMFAEA